MIEFFLISSWGNWPNGCWIASFTCHVRDRWVYTRRVVWVLVSPHWHDLFRQLYMSNVQFLCSAWGTFSLVAVSETCTGTLARECGFFRELFPSSGNGIHFSGALSPMPSARSKNVFLQFFSMSLYQSLFLPQWSVRTVKTVSRIISAFDLFFVLSGWPSPSPSPLQWHEYLVLFRNIASGYTCPVLTKFCWHLLAQKRCVFSAMPGFLVGTPFWHFDPHFTTVCINIYFRLILARECLDTCHRFVMIVSKIMRALRQKFVVQFYWTTCDVFGESIAQVVSPGRKVR